MKINIDTDEQIINIDNDGLTEELPLYSTSGLEALTRLWIKAQWNQLNYWSLSWQGLPIQQLADDLVRLQEVIYDLQPDVIVETGVAGGGSAVFFASLCRLMGKGRVISIDISIPQAVRDKVAKSSYGDMITLIESDSKAPETVSRVRDSIRPGEKTFFFLDSDHSKDHVLGELNAYADMVSVGSYIVATDGVMRTLYDTPMGLNHWRDDNPAEAALEFARNNPNFIIKRPDPPFGREYVIHELTYWPDAWLLRTS